MGKRKKSSRKPGAGKTKMMPLDKSFKCLFCQHTGTVTCKMDTKNRVGRLDCKDCGQTYSTEINHLTEPIDIFSEWIDATMEANAGLEEEPLPGNRTGLGGGTANAGGIGRNRKRMAQEADDEEEEEEEDLPDLSRNIRKRPKAATDHTNGEDDEEDEDLPEYTRRRAVVEDDEDD